MKPNVHLKYYLGTYLYIGFLRRRLGTLLGAKIISSEAFQLPALRAQILSSRIQRTLSTFTYHSERELTHSLVHPLKAHLVQPI